MQTAGPTVLIFITSPSLTAWFLIPSLAWRWIAVISLVIIGNYIDACSL